LPGSTLAGLLEQTVSRLFFHVTSGIMPSLQNLADPDMLHAIWLTGSTPIAMHSRK
jgi:ABC-type sulfate transport system permease subunit